VGNKSSVESNRIESQLSIQLMDEEEEEEEEEVVAPSPPPTTTTYTENITIPYCTRKQKAEEQ